LAVSSDPEHRFDLALQLNDTKTAYQLALESQSDIKWKELAKLATSLCEFDLAQQCFSNAQDYSALLLLATSSGNASMVSKLSEMSREKGIYNAAFLSYFILGDVKNALQVLIETNRLPEAAFFARSYLPSEVSRVLKLWKETPKAKNDKSVQALADPLEYENLFPNFENALKAEKYVQGTSKTYAAKDYLSVKELYQKRNVIAEMLSHSDLADNSDHLSDVTHQLNGLHVEDASGLSDTDQQIIDDDLQ